MKTLITQVGSYVTGDAVADAVVQYWLALVAERRADVVDIPIIDPGGRRSNVRLTLTSTSALAVVDADPVPDFDDDLAVSRLLAQVSSLTPRAHAAFGPGELPEAFSGYDEFTA